MAKKKFESVNMKLYTPKTYQDLQDIVGTLLDEETSILVNLSKSPCKKELVNKAIEFIASSETSFMGIGIKKVYQKVFICYSKQKVFL